MNSSQVNKIEFKVKTRVPQRYDELIDTVNFPSPNNETFVWKYNFVIYAVNYNNIKN